MITLITGAPGAGKSAYLVGELLRLRSQSPDRPLYVGGVPDLLIDHEVLPEPSDWIEAAATANGWRWRFPDGAILVLDEAQSVFRPRPSGSQVPPHVAALEVHRHQGLDVYLCTQAPALIDPNVRRLVGRHVHLRSTWAGRRLLEWSECVDPSSRSERSAAVSRPWRVPRAAIGQYRSASLHVKPSRRVPWQAGLLVLVLVVGAVGGWRVYHRLYGSERVYGAAPASSADSLPASGAAVADASRAKALTPAAFVPRITSRPESAPLYDEIRKVQQIPIVQGCVATADRCTCYTQQATDAFVPVDVCRELVFHRQFDPFSAPVQPAAVAAGTPTDRAPGSAERSEDGPAHGRVVFIGDDTLARTGSGSGSVGDVSGYPSRSFGGFSGFSAPSSGVGSGVGSGGVPAGRAGTFTPIR